MTPEEKFLLFVDTETTGTKAGWHEITEIAAILTDFDMVEISRFHQKIQIRFPDRWDPKAREVNKSYDPEVWAKEAVPFYHFQLWLKKHVVYPYVATPVGHQVGFDRDMIDESYYKPMGQFCQIGLRKIDTITLAMTMKVAKVINPKDMKLATVAEALGIKLGDQAHSAMPDLEAMKQIFERVVLVFQS